jgi:hypothetical protein
MPDSDITGICQAILVVIELKPEIALPVFTLMEMKKIFLWDPVGHLESQVFLQC